jgi:GNAT superfamily N-acetyltransferase
MNIIPFGERHCIPVKEIIIQHIKEEGIKIKPDYENLILLQLKALIEADNSITLVAESGDKTVGYINGHICRFPLIGGTECYITELFVHDEYRRRSAGRMLLAAIEDKAKTKGVKRMILNNHTGSESYNTNFYNKNGFSKRANFANFVKNVS